MESLGTGAICVRKFTLQDVEKKVHWINDDRNHKFLHYDLPLNLEKTIAWFERVQSAEDRIDAVIEVDGKPVGLIGLLNVDLKNRKTEYYICIGEPSHQHRGVAAQASRLLLNYAFTTMQMNRIYLYTEPENQDARHLFETLGFQLEGCLREDLICGDRKVDRLIYAITRQEFFNGDLDPSAVAGDESEPFLHQAR